MKKYIFALPLICLILLVSCKKEEDVILEKQPVVQTASAQYMTTQGAMFTGTVAVLGSQPIQDHGFVWGTSPQPTLESASQESLGARSTAGTFSKSVGNLDAGATYYFRAFATTALGTVYGEDVTFGTLSVTITGFSPTKGTTGTIVTITGTNFDASPSGVAVTFGGVPAQITARTPFQLTVLVPEALAPAQKYNIGVTAFGKTVISTDVFITDNWKPAALYGGSSTMQAFAFTIGNRAYMGGGLSEYQAKDFWEYNPEADTWTRKGDFPGTSYLTAVSFTIGEKGYVGLGNGTMSTDDFWEYTPGTDSWTKKADFPGIQRQGAVAFVLGGKAYVGTGLNNQGTLKDFWEYDLGTNTWTQKADFGGSSRRGAVAFVVNGKGYVTSGWNANNLYNDLWEYNHTTDTWTQKANFGGMARSGAVALVIDNKAYVGTGLSGGSIASNSLNDWWLYDDGKDQWLQQPSVPGRERYGAQAFTLLGKGYVGTGNSPYGMGAVRGFWQFAPAQ